MMDFEVIEAQLIRHEDERLKPYICQSGKTTIGVGRNLTDSGISTHESREMLRNDIMACYDDLEEDVFEHQWYTFSSTIQHVLINMRFQLGYMGFRSFKKTIKAFQEYDYIEAAKEMRASKWHTQTPGRANELIREVLKETN